MAFEVIIRIRPTCIRLLLIEIFGFMFRSWFFADTNLADFGSEVEENAKILARRVKIISEQGNWVLFTNVGVSRDMFNGRFFFLFYKIENMKSCCGFGKHFPFVQPALRSFDFWFECVLREIILRFEQI